MKPEAPPSSSTSARAGASFVGAALALVAFYLVGAVFLDGFALDLGSISYLDEMSWSQTNLIFGTNGIAALTFCEVPILASKPIR